MKYTRDEVIAIRAAGEQVGDTVTDGELTGVVTRVDYQGTWGVMAHIYVDWRVPGFLALAETE